MELQLGDELERFRAEVRSFIDERLPAGVRERMRQGLRSTPEEIIAWQRTLHEKGWAAPHWPREYGGAQLGQAERLILLEETSRAPAPKTLSFNIVLLGPVLLKYGTKQQKDYWLPRLARLDTWFCQGFSEPGSGSDLASLRTTARRDGDHYVVNGQKIWTSLAHHADMIFCLVRTGTEGRKHEGITFLMFNMALPGITVRPIASIDGEQSLNEVFFDDVRVPVEGIVGQEGQGWEITRFLLANERTGIADVASCRERLDYAIALAGRLEQGGASLRSDPHIRSRLAWLDAEVRGLEITNWRLLLTPAEQEANPAFASILKLKGTEIQQEIASLTLRLLGPEGLERVPQQVDATWQTAPATRYLFSRAASIYGGSTEIQKDLLARSVLGS